MRALARALGTPVQRRSRRTARAVAALQVLVAAQVVVFCVSTLGVREDGFDIRLDGWLQGSAYVSCAVLLALRPALSPVDRRLWWLMAAGVACRAAAFTVWLGHVRWLSPQPYPSLADVGWLATYAFLGLALVGLAASRFPRVTAVMGLDAAVAACAAGAGALTVVPELLRRASPAGTSEAAVVVNALYPVLDAALLLLVLGVLLVFDWRPPPAVWLFGAGAVMIAALDLVYLFQVAEGTFRPGTPLSAISVLAVAVIAFSAWVPPGRPSVRGDVVPGLAVPALLAVTCLLMLAWAASAADRALPTSAVVLAVVGVLASVVRTTVSFTNLRQAAAAERRAARQALMERLVEAQDAERARIAADVHDDSVQALAAVDFRLSTLKKRLRTEAPDEVAGVATVMDAVHDAALRLRNLLFELETPALEASLAESLDDAAAHVFDGSGTAWSVQERGTAELPPAVRVSAYRIGRESMVNARKHARASTLTVTVDAGPHGVRVDVVDDGVGVAVSSRQQSGRRHSGVVGMRDRAVASGGWWQSAPGPDGTGTHVSFFLPVVADAAGREDLTERLARAGQPPAADAPRRP
jgi:signal transduction histidine kinase